VASILDELTPAWLKDRFLVGVDLTLDDGTAYPDAIYSQAISASVAFLEHDIGITIDPFEVTGEQHDAYEANRSGFWPFRLDHRPVLKMDKMQVRFGGFAPAELPVTWAQLVSPVHGQIHLIPSEESLHSSYRFTHGIPLITGDVLQPQRYVPGYFHFDYTAGFETRAVTVTVPNGETTGTTTLSPVISLRYEPVISTNPLAGNGITAKVKTRGSKSITLELSAAAPAETDFEVVISTLPADIKQAIGYKAALLPLDVAGDLIAGAGIANLHVGVDGLSQSLGTTCLHKNTRIALTDGTRPTIKSLVDVSEFAVACVDDTGHPRVGIGHSARKTIKDDVLQVNLSTGEHVLCNASHPFRTYGGEYIPAGELRPGIPLTPCSLVTDEPFITVVSVNETGRREWLYDITVDEHHCFGLEAGVIVHNSSATNAGYGARVLQFERELKSLLPALRAKYKAINMGAI